MKESDGEYLYRMDELAKTAKSNARFKVGDVAIVNDPIAFYKGEECRITNSTAFAGRANLIHSVVLTRGEPWAEISFAISDENLLPVKKA